tara:strand:- start:1459 stop:1677 length:219 start_codon:yes stop_codon:yes gene_type:complete
MIPKLTLCMDSFTKSRSFVRSSTFIIPGELTVCIDPREEDWSKIPGASIMVITVNMVTGAGDDIDHGYIPRG